MGPNKFLRRINFSGMKLFHTKWKFRNHKKDSEKYFAYLMEQEKIAALSYKEKYLDYIYEVIHVSLSRSEFFKYFSIVPQLLALIGLINFGLITTFVLVNIFLSVAFILLFIMYKKKADDTKIYYDLVDSLFTPEFLEEQDIRRGIK